MRFDNAYFITGTAYAGKSTMVKLLAEKYNGILCEENYHDQLLPGLDSTEFPFLTYTRDLEDLHDFIRRTPEEYKAWMDEDYKAAWESYLALCKLSASDFYSKMLPKVGLKVPFEKGCLDKTVEVISKKLGL